MPFRDELKQSLQDISAEFSILSLEPRLQEAQGRLQLRLEAMSSAYKDMVNSKNKIRILVLKSDKTSR